MSPARDQSPQGRRRPLVSGNWKMNFTHLEAIQVIQKLSYALDRGPLATVEVSVHPAFTALRSVQTVLDADEIPVALGAQDVHWEDKGPWTGEVSPPMLAKLGVRYVIVGHSERRQRLGETDEQVSMKLRATLRAGMTPICCVGETAEQRDAGETDQVVLGQLGSALEGVAPAEVATMVVAYEPIWAIGTGRTATPGDAGQVCATLRREVGERWGAEAAAGIRILYGGSVDERNAASLLAGDDVDGALVGGASLDPVAFAAIAAAAAAATA
ncbi:MAG: triose-phosphate isomerase [Actinomycetota bacterium]|nr:triose-phosphate isomerase [Actinomycetota bacterium]